MRKFWQNTRTVQEDNGELKKSIAELDCENTIINEKQQFGRVRNSMMRVLREKYGHDIADRTLNRVNKRLQKGHFSKTSTL